LRVAVLSIAASLLTQSAWAQAYKAPRAGDGHADLQGIWQARNTAYGSLEAHGASWNIRAGASVIVDPADGRIPYKPEMLAKRDANFKARATADPVNKCFLPGVPRVMYLPYPVQIFQTPTQIEIASEFGHAIRHIYVSNKAHYGEAEFWMGDSRAKWEGDTLVIDNGNFNAETWLDASGNFHSENLRVIERLARTADDVISYEATLTDPDVYTRPFTIRMPLYRDREPNAQLYEYECHVYLEDEGKLTRK
jgi:hypothetical protein